MTWLSLVFFLICGSPSVSQDWARERLVKSPRHQEWVAIKNGERTVHCFLVYPESKEKASAVVIIHEIMGLTDWVMSVCDQLAQEGYIAIAPDLLSGMGPSGGRTNAFPDVNAIREAISRLPSGQILSDLDATVRYASQLPACNGRVSVAGFCWGGTQAFLFATHNPTLRAVFVFYGAGVSNKELIAKIQCPVYGFYAENDARVNASLPDTQQAMKEAGKTFEVVTYAGAGHGFMRAGEAPDASEANRSAREEAWKRWRELLRKL